MKALQFDGEKVCYRTDYPMPELTPGHSLIRVLMAAVCNTDKEILRGYVPGFHWVMGHEFVGIVEQSDDPSWIGCRVVGEINENCGECYYCKTGRYRHCDHIKTLGIRNMDGAFAEYLVLGNWLLHRVPDDLPTDQAIFTEPLAAAVEIATQVHLNPEKRTAIIGDGRLALMIAQVLSLYGVPLYVVGKHPEKLELFRLYAQTMTVDEADGPFEVVVEASGSPSGIALARRLVCKKGTIVLKSTYSGETTLNLSSFVVDEITLIGSRCGPFEPALELLKKGLVRLPPIELYPLSDYEQAFRSGAFKAGFDIAGR